MSGILRAFCDCSCTQTNCDNLSCGLCGINGLDGFCASVTDNPCPTTLSVSFTIPAYSFTCVDDFNCIASFPAVSKTISVTFPSGRGCIYTGNAEPETVSIPYEVCDTSNTGTFVTRYVQVELSYRAAYVVGASTTVLISSPCGTTPTDLSPPKCAGICLRVTETFATALGTIFGSVHHGQGYNSYELDNCTDQVPCYTSHGGTADLAAHYPSTAPTVTGLVIA